MFACPKIGGGGRPLQLLELFRNQRLRGFSGGQHIFGPIREKADLPNVRFHDLRHSFASMLIHQGESPKYVSDQLGHSSIQMTFDTYGHLFPQAKTEASAKLEKQMFRGQKRPIVRRMLENGEIGDSEEGKKERVN